MIYISSKEVGIFFFLFIRRFVLILGSDDWFIIWIGLEINIFRFIVVIVNNNGIEIESCIKYFFVQSLGSSLLLLRFYNQRLYIEFINRIILRYKIGGGPFYFWFPIVCERIRWISCFYLITIQKIAPIILISIFSRKVIWFLIFIRLFIGIIGAFNQIKLKRLISYSSIHHIGWLLIRSFIRMGIWILYLVRYTYIILGLFFIFIKNEILTVSIIRRCGDKIIFITGILSIGGIPPILGFFLKWWVFYNLIEVNYFIILMMIIFSVVLAYIYLRLLYYFIIGEIYKNRWRNFYNFYNYISLDFLYIIGIVIISFLLVIF